MAKFSWKRFLRRWSNAILASPDIPHVALPPGVLESGWLGFPPATEIQIAAAEARLGLTLPPSYRAFLRVTNGWQYAGDVSARLRPVGEINWFRVENADWIAAFTHPPGGLPDYDPALDPVDYRHLPGTLQISDVGDGAVILLNPAVVRSDGEWQAWFFANWVPGADSHESFQDLLQQSYASQLAQNTSLARQIAPSDPPNAVVIKFPGLIATLEEKRAQYAQASAHEMGIDGIITGLDEVTARVQSLAAEALSPELVSTRLRDLAAALEAEAAQVEADQRQQTDAFGLLGALGNPTQMLASLAGMLESIQILARVQGLRQGASIVRWYLGGR